MKHFFPGLGIATIAFIGYVAADYILYPPNVEALKDSAQHKAETPSAITEMLHLEEHQASQRGKH
jgi:hypothetical protein